MSKATSSSSSSIGCGGGFFGLLTLLFVTLKLVGEHFHTPVADWSWWLVFLPLYGSVGLVIVLLLGFAFLHAWMETR